MDHEILQELFTNHIRDLYDAEKQIVKALPKMIKAVESEDLAEGLRKHLAETKTHVTRLEEVFKMAGVAAKGKPCKGMKGLLEEGSEEIEENDEGPLRDLAIIAAGQKVEHYEISAYGTACSLAEQLDMNDAIELLRQTEEEEKAADQTLTEAAASIYASGAEEEEEEEEDEEDDEGEEDEEEADAEEEEAAPVGASRAATRKAPTKTASKKSSR